jgi:hypothetical protein
MKAVLKQIGIFFMVGAFLLSSAGIVLAKHICLGDKYQSVSLYKAANCCGSEDEGCEKEKSGTEIASSCCVSDVSYYKADVEAVNVAKVSKYFTTDIAFPVNLYAYTCINKLPGAVTPFYSDVSKLALTGGKQILISLHCFMV